VLSIDKFHLSLQTLMLEYFSNTAILIHGGKMKYASLFSSHYLANIIAFECLFLTQSTTIMAGPKETVAKSKAWIPLWKPDASVLNL